MLTTQHNPTTHNRLGLTLVEVVVTMGIVGLLMAGVLGFYRESSLIMYDSEKKSLINRDIRSITEEMVSEARNASHFIIYESFDQDFRDVPTDALTNDEYYFDPNNWSADFLTNSSSSSDAGVPAAAANGDFDPASYYRKRDGQSGDFLLLITYGDDLSPYDTGSGTTAPDSVDYTKPIIKLVGYYRSVENTEDQTGPVRKFVIYPTGSERFQPVEELIPSTGNASSYPVVIELSKGLANHRLFYNYRDSSIMVNGQIIHGSRAKYVTDTYNFTISPRG